MDALFRYSLLLLATAGAAATTGIAALGQTRPEVADLLSRMSVEEKIQQLGHESPAIPRLGLPAYNWWNEALHGVARSGRATVFPQAIGLAATWNPQLLERIAGAIADEARAKHHQYVRENRRGIYQGLTLFAPNINLFRDPRWGRGQETYGEDPLLTARLAVAFIRGLQGPDPAHYKTLATPKHFAVHSGPEASRHSFNAQVAAEDLSTSYLPQFEAAVREAKAGSVMCAYNAVNGAPACANPQLLGETLRRDWGFEGYVVSDCWAISDIFTSHGFALTPEEGVAGALRAGTDLACGPEYGEHLKSALGKGLVTEADIDRSLARLLEARFRLGLLGGSPSPYAGTPLSVVENAEHQRLALEAARQSIVLLENRNQTLPLAKSLRRVAVLGPNADDPSLLWANYNGYPSRTVTPLEGIRSMLGSGVEVRYEQGADFVLQPLRGLEFEARYYNRADFDAAADTPVFARTEMLVDHVWFEGSPRYDLDPDDFGASYTATLTPAVSGVYTLAVEGQNQFDLFLDDVRIAGSYNLTERGLASAALPLEAGRSYQLRLELRSFQNDASIRFLWSPPDPERLERAVQAARESDAVILCLGLSQQLEGEDLDRPTLELPFDQQRLLEAVAALGKPTVLVLLSGSAIGLEWARRNVPAIVQAWYPGQAGGEALADVLFGDYNPSGRLPVTFYRSVEDLPEFSDYRMANRTYRFFGGEPVYAFGHGLSYTRFEVSPPVLTAEGDVEVRIRNAGSRTGDWTLPLFYNRALVAFERLTAVAPGESRVVRFVQPLRGQMPPLNGTIEIR